MKLVETSLVGVYWIDIEPNNDERGFFARTWCVEGLQAFGLSSKLKQCSLSFNKEKGTVRGMHYQKYPYEEIKIVRCTMGVIFDVVIDLRIESKTYKRWISAILSAENRRMAYIPTGCAHGFQTMSDNAEVFYQISELYHPNSSDTIVWNDPAFQIGWPLPLSKISDKDRMAHLFEDKGCI